MIQNSSFWELIDSWYVKQKQKVLLVMKFDKFQFILL